MNILFVIDYFDGPVAGTQHQLMALVRGLLERGVKPRLAVLRHTAFTCDTAGFLCPIAFLDVKRIASLRTLPRMVRFMRALRRDKVDIVQVFFNDASILVPLFAKLAGCRVIVSRRDMGFWYTPGILRALRFANRFVDRITCNSRAVAENVGRLEWSRSRTHVIYNGYSLARMAQPAAPDFRERHGIGESDPIIGIVANFTSVKRHEDLLNAFARVHRNHPDAHLVMVGGGDLQSRLESQAARLQLTRRVHFVGGITDVVPIVKHFEIGVLCSESEGFSNALIEYMACGLPVVCTAVGGNTELVMDGTSGFLVGVRDVDALAVRLERLLSDRAKATEMGAAARRSVERFSEAAMVDEHLRLYDRLLAEKKSDRDLSRVAPRP